MTVSKWCWLLLRVPPHSSSALGWTFDSFHLIKRTTDQWLVWHFYNTCFFKFCCSYCCVLLFTCCFEFEGFLCFMCEQISLGKCEGLMFVGFRLENFNLSDIGKITHKKLKLKRTFFHFSLKSLNHKWSKWLIAQIERSKNCLIY